MLGRFAMGMNDQGPRFKKLAESELDAAQLKVYRDLMSGPRGGVRGPFNALLRSPVLIDRVQKLGEFLRFESSISARLNEFAILITARHWNAQYEWFAHYPHAMKGGLKPEVAADLAQGRRPANMQEDEAIVYDFCKELHEKKSVSDATFNTAVKKFGERGVVDLIGVSGYYTLVSMVLNVDRQPLPAGTPPPLPELK
jgi:4-carboxymuconolactone decarboxylase